MSTANVLRYGVGALGLGLIGLGAWLVAVEPDSAGVLVWLAGALVLHDGILAPLVLVVGLLLVGRRGRSLLRGTLIIAGSVVLVALPLLVRPGEPPNPSALPLSYGRNLAIVLGAVAVVAATLHLVRRRRATGPRRRAPETTGRSRPGTAEATGRSRPGSAEATGRTRPAAAEGTNGPQRRTGEATQRPQRRTPEATGEDD
ncbi:hypothetical protein [Streptomyces roseicoloratus]|uniref:hypothetical protein n=1 Tax=Streptomyces roseicoloratus TaxID=2508722 RepID=UPI001FE332DF|nr:hypothetical protein [Streptomyces roseicoloratus]